MYKDQKTSTPNEDGQGSELYPPPYNMSAIPKESNNAPARTKSKLKPKGMLSLCVFNKMFCIMLIYSLVVLSENFEGNTTANDGDMYITDANPSKILLSKYNYWEFKQSCSIPRD